MKKMRIGKKNFMERETKRQMFKSIDYHSNEMRNFY